MKHNYSVPYPMFDKPVHSELNTWYYFRGCLQHNGRQARQFYPFWEQTAYYRSLKSNWIGPDGCTPKLAPVRA